MNNLDRTVVFRCAFCNGEPIPAWFPLPSPGLRLVCQDCGATSSPVPSSLDSPESITGDVGAAVAEWNKTRQPTVSDRLLTKVTYRLARLARLVAPAHILERFEWLDNLTDDEVSLIHEAMAKARRQIMAACPGKHRAYLAAEFAYLDAIRRDHVDRVMGAADGGTQGALGAVGGQEKTYSLGQLRGAWGAGYHQGKADQA